MSAIRAQFSVRIILQHYYLACCGPRVRVWVPGQHRIAIRFAESPRQTSKHFGVVAFVFSLVLRKAFPFGSAAKRYESFLFH